MSAEILRRAAALMRERADAATEGPWRCDPEHKRDSRPADCYDVIDSDTFPVVGSIEHADAAHIASWQPAIAIRIHDWLLRVADDAVRDNYEPDEFESAVDIAALYLGEQP